MSWPIISSIQNKRTINFSYMKIRDILFMLTLGLILFSFVLNHLLFRSDGYIQDFRLDFIIEANIMNPDQTL